MADKETPNTVALPIGHRIPPELLHHLLLYHLGVEVEWTKPHLGQWALVCREWARVLRPIKFSGLEIRSHKQARDFIELVKSTSLPIELRIGPCVKELCLHQDVSTWSWVHTILCCNTKKLLPNLGFNIHVELFSDHAKSDQHSALMSTLR